MAIGDSIATYGKIDPNDGSTATIDGMVGTYGECLYERVPLFELTIKQLWPDNPADLAEIDRLFGSAALDWWNALTTPAERQERYRGARPSILAEPLARGASAPGRATHPAGGV